MALHKRTSMGAVGMNDASLLTLDTLTAQSDTNLVPLQLQIPLRLKIV